MTLKEKFENYFDPKWLDKDVSAHYCEQIADDYAIEFAKWYHSANNNEYHLYPNKNIEEHLKIFKKEKGL